MIFFDILRTWVKVTCSFITKVYELRGLNMYNTTILCLLKYFKLFFSGANDIIEKFGNLQQHLITLPSTSNQGAVTMTVTGNTSILSTICTRS